MMEKVKANIVAAQARQKEQYDKNISTQKSSQLELLKDMKRKTRAGGKMDLWEKGCTRLKVLVTQLRRSRGSTVDI